MRNFYAILIAAWLALWWAFSPHESHAQILTPRWDQRFGSSGTDSLTFVLQTQDGGYLIGGSSNSNSGGEKSQNRRGAYDYWVARLRPDGTRLWDRTFGGTNDDFLKIAYRYQNGYLLLGSSNSNANGDKSVLNKGGFDIWAVYIDDNGTKLWDKAYGGAADEEVAGAFAQGNNWIIAGSSLSNISGDKSQNSKGGWDYWMVKIDPNGVKLEDLTFGGSLDDKATCVSDAAGSLVGGNSLSAVSGDKTTAGRGSRDYWIVRLDPAAPSLTVNFQGGAGGSGDDVLTSLVRLQNANNGGRWLAVGSSNSPVSGDKTAPSLGDYDYWLVHFNASWTLAGQRVLGTVNRDWAMGSDEIACKSQAHISGTSFGGVNGNKTSDAPGSSDNWILKINADLNPLFDRSLGGPGSNFNFGIKITPDGGFVTGATITGNAGGNVSGVSRGAQDYWIAKIDVRYPKGSITPFNPTVCSDGNTGLLRLSNNSEPIARWESALNPLFSPATVINNLTDSLRFTNLTQTTFYRALTFDDACGFIPSDSAVVTVVNPPLQPNVGPDDTICLSNAIYQRIMPRPQFGTGNWRFISGPASPIMTGNGDTLRALFSVSGTHVFRYEVTNPPCPSKFDDLSVWVQLPSRSGTITASATTICSGTSVTLTLNNFVGDQLQWERQPDCSGPYSDIAGANQSVLITPPLQDTTCYRVRVKNGVCSAVLSAPIQINVGFLQPGVLAPAQSVCIGQNSGVLTLTGANATVVRWESASDSAFTQNVTTITRTLTNFTFSNLTRTTWYRVVLTSNQCQQGFSPVVRVFVGLTTVGGTVNGPVVVCRNQPFNALTLTGQTGNVLFWEQSTNGGQTWTSIANTTTTLSPGLLNITTAFRAVVQSPGCLVRRSQQLTITVQNGPVAGTLGSPRTFCSGTNSGTLVLSGFSGRIVRWESSEDNFSSITSIPNTLNSFSYANLTVTTCYRVLVSSNACQNVQLTSNIVCIVITPPSGGGTVTGPMQGVCIGQNVNDTLRLNGFTGTVVRWERSTNNFVNLTTINNTTDRLALPNNLTQNTQYRAVVRSGQCATALSQSFTVTVSQPSVGGTLTSDFATVCRGGRPTLTLTGHRGQIVWEYASNENSQFWITFPLSSSVFRVGQDWIFQGLTNRTCVRARVLNSPCPGVLSNTVCIEVDTTAGGGVVGQSATVCSGVNGATLTLTGFNGSVVRWESSTDNFVNNITPIANTLPIYTYSNLTQTTRFRAVLQNGNCNAVSAPATITVLPQAVGGFVGGGTTVCAGGNAGQLVLTGQLGQVAYWESSTDNFQNNFTQIANTATTQNYAGLSRTTCYRAFVRSGNCLPVASQAGCITVAPQDTANAGPDQRICLFNNTFVNLSGNVPNGGFGFWSYISGPGQANVNNIGNSSAFVSAIIVPGCYVFGLRITNPNNQFCPIDDDTVQVCVSLPTDARILTRDSSLCVTDSLRLNAQGNGNIVWQFIEGSGTVTPANSLTPTVRNLAFGRNRLVLTVGDPNQTCPVSRDTIIINRIPQPVASTVRNLGNDTVCIGSTVRFLAERPRVGDIIAWEWSEDAFASHLRVNSNDSIYERPNVTRDVWVRYVVKSGACNEVISQMKRIFVRPTPARGRMFGDTTVCAGSYGGVMELRNHGGNIVRWEQSFDNFQTFTTLANTSRFWQFGTTRSVCFRAVLQSANCPTTFSDTGCVSVGGGVPALVTASDTNVCVGGNQGTLTATGFTGNIIRWENSTNGGQSWTTIVNTTATFTFTNLTQRTCFRVVARFNNCPEIFSNVVCINVTAQSAGGIVSPARDTVCLGGSILLTLSQNVGRVIRWEQSTDGGIAWTSINNTQTTYIARPTVRTWYRAVVQNGICPIAFSNVADINIRPGFQAGNIIGRNARCGGGSDTFRLVQYQGNIVRWETAFDPNFFSNPTIINSQSDVQLIQIPNQTIYVRALVRSGNCELYSQTFAVTVTPGPAAPTVGRSQEILCFGQRTALIADGGNANGRMYWYDENNNLLSPLAGLLPGVTFVTPIITRNSCFFAEYREGACTSARTRHCINFDPNMPTQPTFIRLDSVVCANQVATVTPFSPNATQYVYFDAITGNVVGTVLPPGTRQFTFTAPGVYRYRVQPFTNNCGGPWTEFTIRVGGGQDGGQLSGPDSLCTGSSATLTLRNQVGQIIRWESSTDGFNNNIVTINNFSSTLFVPAMTQTTFFRAVVQGCGFNLSNVVLVRVLPCNSSARILGRNNVDRCRRTLDTLTVTGINSRFNDFTNVFISASPTSITNPLWIVTEVEIVNDQLMKIIVPANVPNGQYFVLVENGDGQNNNTWPIAVGTGFSIGGGPCGFGRLLTVSPNNVNTCQNPIVTLRGDTTTFTSTTAVWLSTSATSIVGNNRATIVTVRNDTAMTIRIPRTVPTGQYFIIVENGGRSRPNFNFPVAIQVTVESPQCPDGILVRVNPATVNKCDSAFALVEGQNTTFTGLTAIYLSDISDSLNISRSFRVTDFQIVNNTLVLIRVPGNVPPGPYFVYVVDGGSQNGPPFRNYPAVTALIVEQSAIPGQALADDNTLCSGHSTNIFLQNHVGDVLRWERSNDQFQGNIVSIPNSNSPFLSPVGIYETACYRAIVKNGSCPEAPSQPVCIQVQNPGAGGKVTPPLTEVCGGSSQLPDLTLVNAQLGTVLRWESSEDDFMNVTPITNVTTLLRPQAPLTRSTCYRAVVASGQICNEVYSEPACINVGQQSLPGVASVRFNSGGGCPGDNTHVIGLNNFNGTIRFWESSTNSFQTVSQLPATGDSLVVENLAQTTCFRAVVQSGGCPAVRSNAICVNISLSQGAGAIAGGGTVCPGGNRTLTLVSNSRPVLAWESSTDCISFQPATLIPSNSNSISTGNLTQTTCFRALVQGTGNCAYAVTAPVRVTVSNLRLDSLLVAPVGNCGGLGSINALASGGTTPYTYSIFPVVANPNQTGTFSNLQPGTYTVTVRDGQGCSVSRTATIALAQPDTIRIVSITNLNVNSSIITWTPARNQNGLRYRVRYRIPGSLFWTEVVTSNSTLILQGLQEGTLYEVEVRAECISGGLVFPWSPGSSFITLSSGNDCTTITKPAPTGIYVARLSPTRAVIRWQPVLGAGGYVVTFGRPGGAQITINICRQIDSLELNNLSANTAYQVRIRTRCGECNNVNAVLSIQSPIISFATPQTRTESVADSEVSVNVYPNPNKGLFTLEMSGNEAGGTVQIFDLTGRMIVNQSVTGSRAEFNLEDYASGMYTLRLITGQTVRTVKLIKE